MSDDTTGAAASVHPDDPITAPAGDQGGTAKKKPKRRGAALREVVIILVVALVVSAVVRAFFFQAFYIPSGSMENTLLINDRVIVSKVDQTFGKADPKRGDIVVFRDPGGWLPETQESDVAVARAARRALEVVGLAPSAADQDVIKRVIGVGGDRVICCDATGRITVNGVPLDEKSFLYPGDVPSTIKFDVLVPQDRLFVMGDHRSDSGDSRVHLNDTAQGTVSVDDVIGRAVLLVWPFSRFSTLGVPATFENPALLDSTPGAGAPASTTTSTP